MDYNNLISDNQFLDFLEDYVYYICGPETNQDRFECLLNRIGKNNPALLDEKIENFLANYSNFPKMDNPEKRYNYYMSEFMDHVVDFRVKNLNDLAIKSFRVRYLFQQLKNAINEMHVTDDKRSTMLHNINFFMLDFERLKNEYQ